MIILSVDYVSVSSAWSDPEAIHVASGGLAELPSGPLSTKTVLGFLDFITTVSDTVIKFTSQGGKYLNKRCNFYFRSNSRQIVSSSY